MSKAKTAGLAKLNSHPGSFRSHIRNALQDKPLQEALDLNSERRLTARQTALTSLPEDWGAMRQHAHALRADVITHLDQYLEQFIDRVQANGILVHRAATAEDALEIISEIARQAGAKLIAKSKTMVSEEIGLNHALEAQGFKVVETDLGEYIVQLRQERPSHLLTPAVHLRRQDVGMTFRDKLGEPYTDDIPTLVRIARKKLRQVFLEAELGISGVNFGVVESGTLCILTNEGNGRMVTSVSPVHVALMGIERLVPTLEDLAWMLCLLPRSATGQKMTVYTSLIHGPPRVPGANPRQRHLVLVDNGRRAIRESPLHEVLYCIRCGACLNVCPVFREIGGHAYVNDHGESTPYAGPVGSVLSPAIFGQPEFGNLARASSLCGACREVCPVDIDIPKLLLRVRAGVVSQPVRRAEASNAPRSLAFGLSVYTWIATNPARFKLAQRGAGWLSRIISPSSRWLKLPAFTGWGFSKDFPRPSSRPFRDRVHSLANSVIIESSTLTGLESHSKQVKVSSQPAIQPPPPPPEQALLERFRFELTSIGGSFTLAQPDELPMQMAVWLRQRSISSIMSWEGSFLPTGLLEAVKAAGIDIHTQLNPDLKVGLTGALAGVAETGSLVLLDGPGSPLGISLLPEIHLVCLRRMDIYPSLKDVIALPRVREAPTAILISGPSRTADIEMSLTIGVHGPGELHVFCY